MSPSFYTLQDHRGPFCITVSGPLISDDDDIIGVLGADIRFEGSGQT